MKTNPSKESLQSMSSPNLSKPTSKADLSKNASNSPSEGSSLNDIIDSLFKTFYKIEKMMQKETIR